MYMYHSMDNKLMAEQMVDIMRKCPSITKEQFEATIPSNTSYEAFYKSMYLITTNQ